MTDKSQAPEGAPDLRAAAQTALDALENNTGEYRVTGAASTLRAALAAQPQQAGTQWNDDRMVELKMLRQRVTMQRYELARLKGPNGKGTPAPEAASSPAEGDVAELARWLHAAYDRPPQTPEVRAMLAKADALAAQPQPKRTGEIGEPKIDEAIDMAKRYAEDWADDCVKARYVTTSAPTHARMTQAIKEVAILAATQAPAPAHDRVPMPQNADQAVGMVLLGEHWLREHAPERLKQAPAVGDA